VAPRSKRARALNGFVATVAALLLAVTAAGCGNNSDSGDGGGGSDGNKIALLLPESKTARYEAQDRPYFTDKVADLCPDCEVVYSNAEGDANKQKQQVEAALTRGVKALVIDAVDTEAAASAVKQATDAGIPVLSYARLIQGAKLDAFISVETYRGGQQQAEAMMEKMTAAGITKPRIIMINGSPTDSNAPPFKEGAHSVFDPAGVEVVREFDTPDWDPDKAQQEMEQAITALGADGFDGVYVCNDGMASGAIAAMKAANIDPSTKFVTGQDAEVAALQRIVVGEQFMTLYQPIKDIAETAAQMAVDMAEGKKPSGLTTEVDNGSESKIPAILKDMTVVEVDNIKDTVVAEKFATVEQICTEPYAEACKANGLM
jgi:D-xylose transport system substrate-binding protein